MEVKKISLPLTDDKVMTLKAGDNLLITGSIYTGRDSAHKKLIELIEQKMPLPIDLQGQIIYYVGPAPAKPGQVIGSAGPTTSGRMDVYTSPLLALGLKGCIGKGSRSQAVRDDLVKYRGVYMAAAGGAGALLAKAVKNAEVIAYPELGPEAIYRLQVVDLPVTVVNDAYGNDLYQQGRQQYAR